MTWTRFKDRLQPERGKTHERPAPTRKGKTHTKPSEGMEFDMLSRGNIDTARAQRNTNRYSLRPCCIYIFTLSLSMSCLEDISSSIPSEGLGWVPLFQVGVGLGASEFQIHSETQHAVCACKAVGHDGLSLVVVVVESLEVGGVELDFFRNLHTHTETE